MECNGGRRHLKDFDWTRFMRAHIHGVSKNLGISSETRNKKQRKSMERECVMLDFSYLLLFGCKEKYGAMNCHELLQGGCSILVTGHQFMASRCSLSQGRSASNGSMP